LVVASFFAVMGLFTVIMAWFSCPHCVMEAIIPVTSKFNQVGSLLFWTVLAPFCWYLAYVRLTESELL